MLNRSFPVNLSIAPFDLNLFPFGIIMSNINTQLFGIDVNISHN